MINSVQFKVAVVKFGNSDDIEKLCSFCENDGSICIVSEEENTVLTNVVREEDADNFFKACKAVSWKFVDMKDILTGYIRNSGRQLFGSI